MGLLLLLDPRGAQNSSSGEPEATHEVSNEAKLNNWRFLNIWSSVINTGACAWFVAGCGLYTVYVLNLNSEETPLLPLHQLTLVLWGLMIHFQFLFFISSAVCGRLLTK